MRPVVNGAAWVGADNASVPTTATAALTNFNSLGWLTDSGISMSIDRQVTDIKGFGGDIAVTIQESHDVQFTFTPMEWNDTVVKELFGQTATAASVKITGDDLPMRKFVFDMRGSGSTLVRVVVPVCKVVSVGEIPFKHNEPMAAEITLKAFPDSTGGKVYIYKATASS